MQAVSIRWYNACAWYAVTLADALGRAGMRPVVIGGEGSPAIEKAHGLGLETVGLSGGGAGSFVRRLAFCRRFARDNRVRLVNVHDGGSHLLWVLALRGTGIPVVRTSGNQIPPKAHPAARLLMGLTSGVIASCGTVRGYYTGRFGMDGGGIPVINGGIDTDHYASVPGRRGRMRAKLGLPDDAFVYGILARFSPDKGHRFFFRAAEKAAAGRDDVRFLVAGWNAQLGEDDMRAMAAEAGVLEKTVFTGRHPDSRDLIETVDAGVITSVASETICRIAMEYMAMQKPVAAFGTNVISEIVADDVTGAIVGTGDAAGLARAMTSLAGPDGRARGMEGRRRAESRFSLDSFAERTIDAYRSFGCHV